MFASKAGAPDQPRLVSQPGRQPGRAGRDRHADAGAARARRRRCRARADLDRAEDARYPASPSTSGSTTGRSRSSSSSRPADARACLRRPARPLPADSCARLADLDCEHDLPGRPGQLDSRAACCRCRPGSSRSRTGPAQAAAMRRWRAARAGSKPSARASPAGQTGAAESPSQRAGLAPRAGPIRGAGGTAIASCCTSGCRSGASLIAAVTVPPGPVSHQRQCAGDSYSAGRLGRR